jgi:ABC-type branched-subunit amino acid transport system substrate-binding protein
MVIALTALAISRSAPAAHVEPNATVEASGPAPSATAAKPAADRPPPPAVRGVSDGEIVLGMSAAFSGPARDYGIRMKLGLEAAFAAVNAQGGVAGRKLTLVALDDGYEAKRTEGTMKELVESRGVFAIVGNTGTPTAAVAAPYAAQKKVVFFGAFSGSKLLRQDPPDRYVFNYRPSYQEETERVVRYVVDAKKIPPEDIVLFAQHDAFGDTAFDGAVKALRRYGRTESQLLRTGYERNSVDVETAVNDITRYHNEVVVVGPNNVVRARHPVKVVILMATTKPAAKLVQRLGEKGLRPLFLATSASGGLVEELNEQDLVRYARDLIMTQVVPHYESGGTGVLRYREALDRFFPDQRPDPVSLEGYIAGGLFAEGVRRVGRDLDGEKLVAALEALRDYDPQIGSILSFGPSEHQASHKVWGSVLDESGHMRPFDLD